MQNIQSATLSKTMKYKSQSGKQYKYEIYQSSDGLYLIAMVHMLEEMMTGSGIWVWSVIEEDLLLLSGGQHPDFAAQEARKHFNDNYIKE